jgi:putative pyruvate formate lyase activating enzyme
MSRIPDLYSLYKSCTLCPRACGVNRMQGRQGFCREGMEIRIACACLHRGEEPPLSGSRGSGTIFFSGCTLKCLACQNYQLSKESLGCVVSDDELKDIMLRLQERVAENINLVTGSHFLPGVIIAIQKARDSGLRLPIVWNTSGYETEAALKLINPLVDIYLADLKTLDRRLARRICRAADYPALAERALLFMADKKSLCFTEDKLVQGVVMRHLVLPGEIDSSRAVLAWFKQHLYGRALLSLMVQFLPVSPDDKRERMKAPADLKRMLTPVEYQDVLGLLDEYGIQEGFVQELARGKSWLPDFIRLNPFPAGWAEPVWHYQCGFIN